MTRPDTTIQLGPDPHLLEQRAPSPWLSREQYLVRRAGRVDVCDVVGGLAVAIQWVVYEAVAHRGVTYLIQDDALPEPCSASVRQHQTADGEMRMTAGIT